MQKDIGSMGVIVTVLFLSSTAHAFIWYVHPDSALNSIQAGLDSCTVNDVVLVAPGVYYENIIWPNTQGIHLISELGPDTTIIDGDTAGCGIEVFTGVDSTTIINGFTIQNGYFSEGGGICCNGSSPTIASNIIVDNVAYVGGGICCMYNSSPFIIDNTITDNTVYERGGGIYCYKSSPKIIGNIITNNLASPLPNCDEDDVCHEYFSTFSTGDMGYQGGGIACDSYSSPTIADNTIVDNTATGSGGGIACDHYCSPLITGNTITGNTANGGGGICCIWNSSSFITDNTITGNTAGFGGGIGCYFDASPTITNSTIANNVATSDSGGGVYCKWHAMPTIDSCIISNNSGDGVYSEAESSPLINYNNITSNTGYGVRNVDDTVIVNAENNWWGDPTGPGGAGPGAGDSVSAYVDYDPWVTEPFPWGIEEHEPCQTISNVLQISPNPFRNRVDIRWQIENIGMQDVRSKMQDISLKIYDVSGRIIRSFDLASGVLLLASTVSWNGTDASNRKLPSGVYFLKLKAGDYSATAKLLLIR